MVDGRNLVTLHAGRLPGGASTRRRGGLSRCTSSILDADFHLGPTFAEFAAVSCVWCGCIQEHAITVLTVRRVHNGILVVFSNEFQGKTSILVALTIALTLCYWFLAIFGCHGGRTTLTKTATLKIAGPHSRQRSTESQRFDRARCQVDGEMWRLFYAPPS